MEQRTSLAEIIEYIDPGSLSYQDWVNVGMALKLEGYPISVWDQWSQKDFSRYHSGECERKWRTFSGSSSPVTGGTIVQMAIEHGWVPERGHELDWNDSIQIDSDRVVVDKNWLEGKEIHEPENWNPAEQLITYLETLFEAGENVGYVTGSWEKTDEKGTRWLPQKGSWDRTAGQLIEQLNSCNGDIGSVFGDYNPEAGAWIRFNPLDGNGCKNENVTEYRYALVESDHMDLEKQNAILRELELPIACLVYSGKKSLHAIVRVDAADYSEYRKRVDYLYEVCQKNGIDVDTQNRNPSRLSRMPGVQRGEKKQFIVDTNLGKASWNEWYEWIEGVNDDLPEPEGLESVWDNLPELSPCLIEGVLRKGHKMLIAGPSKAGKSFLQIELCIAIAEGRKWLQWHCAQGRVMYVNLELDRASCLHRFKDVYTSMGIAPENLQNIDIWNLRGKSVPMDKLAPKLIRRAAKKDYVAIIIDPIYKVITGDENSADQMANFCNQFDKVCTELGCAVIYCHHHSKGSQGGKKSMDRASGSGVFARDPDALLDESFGGNVSGVAMEFKLLGMENITKIKTRYYRKGLRKRIRIFCRFLSMKEKIVDPEGITMTFTRALPKNLLEISQMVSNLKGIVSQKTLLAQIPFVEDVDEEMAAVKKESEESLKQQQEMFGMQGNDPPEENDPDKSSQKKTEEKKVDE